MPMVVLTKRNIQIRGYFRERVDGGLCLIKCGIRFETEIHSLDH